MILKLAVVIPVFNEGDSLRNTLPQLVREIFLIDSEIAVFYVNDGSTDNTLQVLSEISKSENFSNLHILALEKNKGYGGALRHGAKVAHDKGFQAVVFMDSDLTNPTSEILGLASRLDTYDLVKASRYIKGADASEVPWRRRCFSVVGNVLLRLLFRSPIQDVTNGFRAWRLEQYLSFECKRNGFDSIIEEFYFARLMDLRISELPSTLKSRGGDLRESSSSYTFTTFYNYLAPALLYFSRRFK
jgi:glycosyltransferase involved in cell wall biosynthesis